MTAILSKGDAVKVAGTAGVGRVVDIVCAPGEKENRVKVAWYRPRSGKFLAARWEYERHVTKA